MSSSQFLVDPEVAGLLDVFAPVNLSSATLASVRAAQAVPAPGAPDPRHLYPGVKTIEQRVPGAPGDPDVRVLWYAPTDRTTTGGALVWFHGGGYVLGTADNDEIRCRRIVTETGLSVASVDYRLAPETKAPGQVYDAYAALSWVHQHAVELGIDPGHVAVGGASAGGGLAAGLATLARDRGDLPICFQLLIYPMLDDRTATVIDPAPYAGEFIWTPSDNRFGWTSLLVSDPGGPDTSPYAAPARVESVDGLPPTYISVGALDLFADENIAYAQRLVRAGVPTELHVYPGGYHAFDLNADAAIARAHTRDYLDAIARRVARF